MSESPSWNDDSDIPEDIRRAIRLVTENWKPIPKPSVEEVALACGMSHQQAVSMLTMAGEPVRFLDPANEKDFQP